MAALWHVVKSGARPRVSLLTGTFWQFLGAQGLLMHVWRHLWMHFLLNGIVRVAAHSWARLLRHSYELSGIEILFYF